MNACSPIRPLAGQHLENNVNLSSSSQVDDEMVEEKDPPALTNTGRHLQLRKAERRIERGVPLTVTYTAPLPTNSGYYTDQMLGTAALQPNTSLEFKERCLAAQNARVRNEIPRQPKRDHGDYLLREARFFRRDMHARRKFFVEVAQDAARWAKCVWEQERKDGDPTLWTDARTRKAMEVDAAEKAREAANVTAPQPVEIPEISVVPPTPRKAEKMELPARRSSGFPKPLRPAARN